MIGTVHVTDRGAVRVHTYVAPDASVNVTSHVVETPHSLVVVDAQFLGRFADEVVELTRDLGKPVDRVVITHAHPDHYAGAGHFDAPKHALPVVIDQIRARGDVQDPTGTTVALRDVLPTQALEPGTTVIDGVPFVFEAVSGGEAPDQLVVKLPEQRVAIVQDLVYNHIHLFLGDDDIPGWRRAVAVLAADPGYDVVLPGHGQPTTPAVYAEVERYLATAAEVLGDDGDAYKAAITERYPDYDGTFVIDIANRYLFGAGH